VLDGPIKYEYIITVLIIEKNPENRARARR